MSRGSRREFAQAAPAPARALVVKAPNLIVRHAYPIPRAEQEHATQMANLAAWPRLGCSHGQSNGNAPRLILRPPRDMLAGLPR